ncbi:hypothetical protein [Streptomyces sp. enrichment culture]|uniref:hypothetical protein n=1 Tax=Streptomyces sp. enrichment culture TaxID=1795815 RepID=UPI003F57186D
MTTGGQPSGCPPALRRGAGPPRPGAQPELPQDDEEPPPQDDDEPPPQDEELPQEEPLPQDEVVFPEQLPDEPPPGSAAHQPGYADSPPAT